MTMMTRSDEAKEERRIWHCASTVLRVSELAIQEIVLLPLHKSLCNPDKIDTGSQET